jgi:hypothetical protein
MVKNYEMKFSFIRFDFFFFLIGETLSFECLIYSLFEFVQVLMDLSTYKNSVKSSMEELCYYLILCMQITEEEVKKLFL